MFLRELVKLGPSVNSGRCKKCWGRQSQDWLSPRLTHTGVFSGKLRHAFARAVARAQSCIRTGPST
jgi:hypothetical protein